jgi:hypothetical protein
MRLQSLNAAFQNPPLLAVRGVRGPGQQTQWELLQEDVPLSSLHVRGGTLLARFYNPTWQAQPFSRETVKTDVWGREETRVTAVRPKEILTVRIDQLVIEPAAIGDEVTLPAAPVWRVGPNKGRPDEAILAGLEEKIAAAEVELAGLEAAVAGSEGAERLRRLHRYYVVDRERLELALSLLLNRRKLADGGAKSREYLYGYDEEIAAVGKALNRLRIKRRVFDYVVQALD